MKKKTLPLLMLIAGLSTAALAACGHDHKWEWKNSEDGTTHWQECACGEKLEGSEGVHIDVKNNDTDADGPDYKCDECGVHVHKYEWKSDAEKHWQECVEEGNINEGKHVDVKNNSTNAPTSDYKCDDCGREATVRINMLGHGLSQTPDNLYIDLGEKVPALDDLEDDDCWKFTGWYKDDACTDPFDFDTPIDAATPIYAGWEEDTTPGASRTHAYELDGEHQRLEAAKPGEVVFFKFTAEEEGRYTVAQGSGTNSENSTFKTTLTGDEVYGEGHDSNVTFDMDKEQTVYVLFSYLGEGGSDATAGVILTETTDEPLPEDYFFAGEYFGESVSIEITNRTTAQTIVYNEETYTFRYIGGKFDRIYFVNTNSTLNGDITYYLAHNEDGTYTLSSKIGDGKKTGDTVLKYFEPQPPVALEKLFGYYEPEGVATDRITELYIFESESAETTSVLYKQNGNYHDLVGATYNTEKNRLTFGYTATLNLAEDGSVESIIFGGNKYVLKGEAGAIPPAKIDLGEGTPEYYGETYAIISSYTSQLFGAKSSDRITDKITVISYVNGVYTVSAANTTYKVTVSADKQTISLYEADGTTLIDTLTLFAWNFRELPAAQETVTLAASDFQKNQVAVFKAKTAGWYSFTGVSSENAVIRFGLNADDPLFDIGTKKTVGEDPVYLEANMVLGVFMETPAAVSFTVAPASIPDGWVSTSPKLLNDGYAVLKNVNHSQEYYFQYTAPAAGSYNLRVYLDGENGIDNTFTYTVNGAEYGYFEDPENTFGGEWKGGLSYYWHVASIEVEEGNLQLDIVVTTTGYYDPASITVAIVGDYEADAIPVELEKGTPANNSLTYSAEINTGVNYSIYIDGETPVTATASAAFTVKTSGGLIIEAIKSGDVFVLSIPTDTYNFTVASATSQTVTLSRTYEAGSEGYPLVIELTDNTYALTVDETKSIFFMLPAGTYIIDTSVSEYDNIELYNGYDYVQFGQIITVEDDVALSCTYYGGFTLSKTINIKRLTAVLEADQVGTYTGKIGTTDVTLKIENIYGSIAYTAGYKYNVWTTKNEDGSYSFTYGYGDNKYTVTFTFAEGKLQVTDTNLGSATLEKQAAVASVTYVGTLMGGDHNVRLEIAGDNVTLYVDDVLEADEVTVKLKNGKYTFTSIEGDDCWYEITDGDTVSFYHSYWCNYDTDNSGTLTKQS